MSLGCQENRYATPLRSLLPSFREKLVLLQGDTDMATDIADLQLPSLVIPNLFMPQKRHAGELEARETTSSYDSASTSTSSPPSSPSDASSSSSRAFTTPPPPPYNDHPEHPAEGVNGETVKTPVPQHSPAMGKRSIRVILGSVSGPVSYRPTPQHWALANQLSPSDHSTDFTPTSSGSSVETSGGRYRRLNPNIVSRSFPLSVLYRAI